MGTLPGRLFDRRFSSIRGSIQAGARNIKAADREEGRIERQPVTRPAAAVYKVLSEALTLALGGRVEVTDAELEHAEPGVRTTKPGEQMVVEVVE